MAWDYNDRIKELFSNATNQSDNSHFGEIENPDGVGQYGSISCGDAIVFYFNVEKNMENPLKDRIILAKYQTFGCTSAIASSEALCEILEKRKPTPLEALKITSEEIVENLGGMPDQKIHCSVMGAEVLQVAVEDWAMKREINLTELVGAPIEYGGDILCDCYDLTNQFIRAKIHELNLKTSEQVADAIKAGGACGSCKCDPGGINDILEEVRGFRENKNDIKKDKVTIDLSPVELKENIKKLFEGEMIELMRESSARAHLVEVKDNIVYCFIQGNNSGCPVGDIDLKVQVENILHDKISTNLRVIDI